jgi:hypothetical protein
MSQQCRSCEAEVIFVPSAKTGKPMILDAKPEKRVVLVTKASTTDVAATVLVISSEQPENALTQARVVDTYVDHHATCPASAEWKGRTRAGAP